MMKSTIVTIILLVLISGCVGQGSEDTEFFKNSSVDSCIKICNSAKDKQNLFDGPCIGNPIPNHPDWVCDVAHSPRTEVDDKPENQCSAFREGKAHHFVEVDSECNLIKAV